MSKRSFGVVFVVALAFFAGLMTGRVPAQAQDEETKPKKPKKANPVANKPPLKFERLNSRGQGGRAFLVFRAKISGGWLVFTKLPPARGKKAKEGEAKPPQPGSAGVTFVLDTAHLWNGGSTD